MGLSIWRRLPFVLVALAAALLAAAPAAFAERRVALVIGNGDYRKVAILPNPARDAAAIEKMLRGAGFEAVEVKRDLGRDAMRRALRDFSDKVRDADIAVVFYAGHGIEVNGANYLVPVDAGLDRDIDVEDEAVPLDRVSQVLEPAKRLRLVILDACRDNPFVRSMQRTAGTRSVGRGLAKVEVATTDTLVAFAAKAGSVAEDGQGANSPYTSALIKHLATPGLDVRLAFGRVRDEVLKSTKRRQEPFVYGSLGGTEIALVPAVAGTLAAPPSAADEAVRICRQVEDMTSPALLGVMANQHKGTPAADCIAARLAELKQMEAAKRGAQPSSAADQAAGICREVENMTNQKLLGVMADQHKGTPAADCIAVRLADLKAPEIARAKAEAKRLCADLQAITDVADVKAKAGEAMGTPAEACLTARIDALQKLKLTLAAPKAAAPLTAAQERELKPKDSFKECDVCPVMVVVPAGSFMMGSPEEEKGRHPNREGPQRLVQFARPFAVGMFEVSLTEWDDCVVEGGCSAPPSNRNRRDSGGKLPVSVSWDRITQQYLPWLSGKTGKAYRLLSEAEWEYVARAGTTTPYWWGSSISPDQAQYNYGTKAMIGTRRDSLVPVDAFAANPWGLYNVHGNAWEWVQDCNIFYGGGAPSDGSARTTDYFGRNNCTARVLRGGSLDSSPDQLRSAHRGDAAPNSDVYNSRGRDGVYMGVGFRVGRTLER
jgi:formylglycine-generating enzyme required for sulfatase activity